MAKCLWVQPQHCKQRTQQVAQDYVCCLAHRTPRAPLLSCCSEGDIWHWPLIQPSPQPARCSVPTGPPLGLSPLSYCGAGPLFPSLLLVGHIRTLHPSCSMSVGLRSENAGVAGSTSARLQEESLCFLPTVHFHQRPLTEPFPAPLSSLGRWGLVRSTLPSAVGALLQTWSSVPSPQRGSSARAVAVVQSARVKWHPS